MRYLATWSLLIAVNLILVIDEATPAANPVNLDPWCHNTVFCSFGGDQDCNSYCIRSNYRRGYCEKNWPKWCKCCIQ